MIVTMMSFGAIALVCSGTQSSGPFWSPEPTRFEVNVEGSSFSGSNGPFQLNLEKRKLKDQGKRGLLLTATLREFPRASFSARLTGDTSYRSFNWEVLEATARDGRRTLQFEGKAICAANSQGSNA